MTYEEIFDSSEKVESIPGNVISPELKIHLEKKLISIENSLNEDQYAHYNEITSSFIEFKTSAKPRNIFLTGGPGTGKTLTLGAIILKLRLCGINVTLAAPTGRAAENAAETLANLLDLDTNDITTVVESHTIHSLFSCPPELLQGKKWDEIYSIHLKYKPELLRIWEETNVLVIEEVSMLLPELFLQMSAYAKKVHERMGGEFGKIGILAVGDFRQLKPIQSNSKILDPSIQYVFQTRTWADLNFSTKFLTKYVRAKNKEFQEMIERFGNGTVIEEDFEKLKQRIGANPEEFVTSYEIKEDGRIRTPVVALFATNDQVKKYNDEKMKGITALDQVFEKGMIKIVLPKTKSGGSVNISESQRKTMIFDFQNTYSRIPEKVILKTGCFVICTRNIPSRGVVNGSLGFVTNFNEKGTPLIHWQGKKEPQEFEYYEISKSFYKKTKNGFNQKIATVKCSMMPLELAYGMTFHKAQGMTFPKMIMSLESLFDPVQLFVGLSRVQNLESLQIIKMPNTLENLKN